MERVLDTYKLPYDEKYPVICMDESPKQLIETKAILPIKPGRETRRDYEYIRHGMVNIFIANEPLTGKRLIKIMETKKKKDWAQFMKEVSGHYSSAEKILLVLDNYNTHNASSFYETYSPFEARQLSKRFEFIYTPKHGSWLNMAEIELHVLNQQCLNRYISDKDRIIQEVNAWQKQRNTKEVKINWQFTNENARIKLKRLYPSYPS
jgi:hypothetical protein